MAEYDILDTRAAPALSAGPGEPLFVEPEPAAPETPPAQPETPPATPVEPAPPETPPPPEEPPTEPEPKSAIERRFSTLAEQRRAAEAREAAAVAREERLAKMLEEALARVPKEAPETPPQPEPRPARETFETPDAYDDALIAWAGRERERTLAVQQNEAAERARADKEAADRTAAEAAQAATFETIRTTHNTRREAFIAQHPDYEEVAERNDGTLQISLPMGLAIMQSDEGPAVAYYLGKHPEVAAKIAEMTVKDAAGQPVPDFQRQLVEMGKVFATVAAQPPPPRPAPLPEPITPIRGGNGAAVAKTLAEIGNEDGTMAEYGDRRLAELRASRRPFFNKPN